MRIFSIKTLFTVLLAISALGAVSVPNQAQACIIYKACL
jgi:hypothetical protein